ncbi:MAG: selenium cofactor biosynthesis protein YqeC, partial [Myxococcota bacterium]
PASHEPQIPPDTALLVAVAGIDALAAPIAEVAHRPERVSAVTGLAPDEWLDASALAQLLASPEGGLKDRPAHARAAVLLNKVETPEDRERARDTALGVLARAGFERVLIGALQGHLPADQRAADSWDWEVHAR